VLTLFAGRGSWRQRIKARAETLFPLPDARTSQLAMLAVNPATAWLMLTEFVVLRAGDWVLQNAGNSGVGRNVVRLGRALGLRTVSIVRQEDQVAPLSAIGSDAVLVDGDDLPARVEAATGGAHPRLAFDAVGGEATRRLADSLAEGGVVVNYGMLSGRPCTVDPSAIVFRDISLCGFWLGKWFQRTDPEIKRGLYDKLCGLVADGTIDVPVEATYALPQIRDALRHAAQPHRSGKVLLLPNGPIEG
jgi:NADPH:quinone reductase-like Zn-dependent oxidoreductase